MKPRSFRLSVTFGLLFALISLVMLAPSATFASVSPSSSTAPPDPESLYALSNGASLHNPGFDNHMWYAFGERYSYGSIADESWVPDDDVVGGPQDWRIWYQDSTVPILTWASSKEHDGNKSVAARTHWSGTLSAGLYQRILNTTPCLSYEFQIYGHSKTSSPADAFALRVGIATTGYYPSNVAVHDMSAITWGLSHQYHDLGIPGIPAHNIYGPLTVTAEAVGTSVAVYSHAYAYDQGGDQFWWDSASLREATPDLLSDPEYPPPPSGISGFGMSAGSTSATVSWMSAAALGQVYYRPVPGGSPAPTTLTHTVYLPLVIGPGIEWQSTILNKTPQTIHSEFITGLQRSTTYEVIAVSRGPSGAQCATWVSSKQAMVTSP